MNKSKLPETTKILLTSFQTWLIEQKSNSSDDLLAIIQESDYTSIANLFFLRNLPVDIYRASHQTISEIKRIQPDVIICCGMAQKRSNLTIESNASWGNECLYTSVDLTELTKILMVTKISDDAGKFVCEGLYYQVLKYIRSQHQNLHCIFVHVPLLEANQPSILRDFRLMIGKFADKAIARC
jgi:pyroglutamyl-peptidase